MEADAKELRRKGGEVCRGEAFDEKREKRKKDREKEYVHVHVLASIVKRASSEYESQLSALAFL